MIIDSFLLAEVDGPDNTRLKVEWSPKTGQLYVDKHKVGWYDRLHDALRATHDMYRDWNILWIEGDARFRLRGGSG